MGHARISASAAERWMACPGSIALIDVGEAQSADSDYSTEGTAAHALGAHCIESGREPWEFIGTYIVGGIVGGVSVKPGAINEAIEVTADMAAAVQVYVDYVRALPNAYTLEQKIDFEGIHDDGGGTADCWTVHHDEDMLEIIDYKHGEGIYVEVEDNPQLMYYAFGLVRAFFAEARPSRVKLTIAQPRCSHGGPLVRSCTLSTDALVAWGLGVMIPAMDRAAAVTGVSIDLLHTGEHCRFCPAQKALKCPKIERDLTYAAEPAVIAGVEVMTDEYLAELKEKIVSVRIFIKTIEDEVYKRLLAGKKIPGFGLYPKKAERVFKDKVNDVAVEDAARAEFGDAAFTAPVLRSPAQLEKLPRGDVFITQWAYKPDTGLTVKPLDAKKAPVILQSTAEKFAAYTQSKED